MSLSKVPCPQETNFGRLLTLDLASLLGILTGLGECADVLDLVFGCLHDDTSHGVVAGAPGPPRDLVELTCLELPRAGAVVLGQPREQYRADRHVDADTEGVGAADDLEEAVLRELLDQASVLGQHACVVDSDSVSDQPRECLPESGGEPESAQGIGDGRLLLLGAHVDAGEGLRPLERCGLCEVHDVHRGLMGGDELFDGLADRNLRVRERQRNGSFGARDLHSGSPGTPSEIALQESDVAECRRHEQELCVREFDDRYLPRPPAFGFGIEMELVHHDLADVGVRALAQREVRDDLGGRADDRCSRIDGGVAGHHSDLVAPNTSHSAKNFSLTSALIGAV